MLNHYGIYSSPGQDKPFWKTATTPSPNNAHSKVKSYDSAANNSLRGGPISGECTTASVTQQSLHLANKIRLVTANRKELQHPNTACESVPNNQREITILSNISKVLEKLIMLKILQQKSPPTLNLLQGGFREHMSCAHTAFILQEAIDPVTTGPREKGLCGIFGCKEGT